MSTVILLVDGGYRPRMMTKLALSSAAIILADSPDGVDLLDRVAIAENPIFALQLLHYADPLPSLAPIELSGCGPIRSKNARKRW